MKRRIIVLGVMLAMVAGAAAAQDLRVEYRFNVARPDASNNYFSFIGPIRYMSTQRDQYDTSTGASRLNSTAVFQPYRLDVLGRNALPDGLRGLFLFAVSDNATRTGDNFTATKAADGTITIQFVHRGTAYRLVTDRNGRLNLPDGTFQTRRIGYIQGAGPQVISRDFSREGTAATVDWARVWNPGTRSGQVITSGQDARTGELMNDGAAPDSMYYWQGALQVALDRDILTVTGGVNAVKR